MKLTITHIQIGVVCTVMAAIGIIGCQDADYPPAQPSYAGVNNSTTRVLFVNATPDASSVRFSVENSLVSTLAPGAASAYIGVPLGAVAATSPQIRVSGAGGTLGTAEVTSKGLLSASNTAFVTDSINRPAITNAAGTVTDAGGVRTVIVADNLTPPTPGSGNTHVRVFNFSPDNGTVSVALQPTSPASLTTTPTFANRGYRVTSVTSGTVTTNYANFTPITAGTYTAQVYSGTAVVASAAPILTVPNLVLSDGRIYTIYTRGLSRTRTLRTGIIQHN